MDKEKRQPSSSNTSIAVKAPGIPPSTKKSATPFWVTFVAGGYSFYQIQGQVFMASFMCSISGTVGAVLTNPLEVVKTRMQPAMTSLSPTGSLPNVTLSFRISPLRATWMHIVGTLSALKGIYVNEGLTSLWRGMGPTIVGVMPSRAIYFSTYGATKGWLAGNLNEGRENALVHLGSALTAGIVTSTATNPIWLVKTRMQLQSGETKGREKGKVKGGESITGAETKKVANVTAGSTVSPSLYRNSFHCLQVVARTEGLRGLYKGLTASYLGTAEGTIQWVLYEKLKQMRSHHRASHARSESSSLTWIDYFLTAASAKLVAAIIAYPHEVLRTRLREDGGKYTGLLQTAMRILREEGPTAYYGGMTAHLMRVVPNSAIMFFCYECIVLAYGQLAQ